MDVTGCWKLSLSRESRQEQEESFPEAGRRWSFRQDPTTVWSSLSKIFKQLGSRRQSTGKGPSIPHEATGQKGWTCLPAKPAADEGSHDLGVNPKSESRTSLVNQLATVEMKLDDELQALLLLSSLPDSWETLVVSLSNSTPNEPMAMEMEEDVQFDDEHQDNSNKTKENMEIPTLVLSSSLNSWIK
ncbi:hypothetical protein RJ640_011227 [Escallonia rubra]|uniref:Uncharacterized protein n=1 Tax=Escallonia rubra TaxID=112253 RepID=A0AA88RED5_9ASTE|nr:hypothetical protein RJ640_011227 [Escallonia rubra]